MGTDSGHLNEGWIQKSATGWGRDRGILFKILKSALGSRHLNARRIQKSAIAGGRHWGISGWGLVRAFDSWRSLLSKKKIIKNYRIIY